MSCLLQTYCLLSTNNKMSIRCQICETCGIMNCGSGWRKDVVNHCSEFVNVCVWCECMCVTVCDVNVSVCVV